MTSYQSLYLISCAQTIGISLLLFFYKSHKIKTNRYLSLFFLVLFLQMMMPYLNITLKHPATLFFPLNLYLLDIVMLFFYASKTTGVNIKHKYKYYIPAGIEFFSKLIIFIILLSNPKNTPHFSQNPIYLYYYPIFNSAFIIFVTLQIIKVVNTHNELLPLFFKEIKYKKLTWLKVFCITCIFYNALWHLQYFVYKDSYFIYVLSNGTFLITLYYITIVSLVQINIFNITNKNGVQEKSYSQDELEEVFDTIEKCMQEEKLYRNSSITLKKFSKTIKIKERIISRAINTVGHKNFKNYLNHYRIEEFKKLLTLDDYKNYCIVSIAFEVGFNSKTSFYKNFKNTTGVSPSDYIEKSGF